MKTVKVYPPLSIDNLRIEEIEEPVYSAGKILVKVHMAVVNPLEYNLIHGRIVYNINPIPHIPGSEILGIALNDGKEIKKGERVIVYPRVFDETCDQCLSGNEHLCKNGGLWGVTTNGGYTEIVSINEKNLFKVPENISDELAVSIPIGALTAYRALLKANVSAGKKILIYGASGNTGIFLTQLADIFGMDVYAVSRKNWIKEYGAIEVFDSESIPEDFTADIVINSLGSKFWDSSIKHLAIGGALVTFGAFTGREGKIDIANLYTRELRIIGSTGGTKKDLFDLLNILKNHELKAPVSKIFKLTEIKEALKHFEQIRDGRILIKL